MSNARKPAARAGDYRDGYLKSPVWFARRDRWFDEEQSRSGQMRCGVCVGAVERAKAELHHLSYDGVDQTAAGWAACESHEDLVCIHRRCHEWLHRLLDRDTALRRMKDRRLANRVAIARLRARLRNTVRELTTGGA